MHMSRWKNAAIYAALALLWIFYLFISLRGQNTEAGGALGLTDWQLDVIRITIAVPYLLIWVAAFYGARRLQMYQMSLDEGSHRKAFRAITVGLYWLAAGLVITTIVSTLRNLVDQSGSSVRTFTIILNYLYTFFPLIGFLFLRSGSRTLLKETHGEISLTARYGAVIAALLIGALQLYLIFTDPGRSAAIIEGGMATYYLPDVAIVLTLVLPNLIALPLGTLATSNLYSFARRSVAVIYEKTLPLLANGIMMIVVATILLQLLLSLGSERLLSLGLVYILIVIYMFLVVQAAGYLLVARGTGRLARLQRTLAKYQDDPIPSQPQAK